MVCGTKYANVDIRVERWDAAPPLDLKGWEDRDELPLEELADAGPLQVAGFEPADAPGLDIEGLGRARVRVQANAGTATCTASRSTANRWRRSDGCCSCGLIAITSMGWPVSRVASPGRCRSRPTDLRSAPWSAAMHSWEQTGWSFLLSWVDAFRGIQQALRVAGTPVALDQLPAFAARAGRLVVEGEPTMQMPLPSAGAARAVDTSGTSILEEALAMSITTLGDLVTALRQLGLLTRTDQGTAAPNPAPSLAWEVLDLPDKLKRHNGHHQPRAGLSLASHRG